MANMKNLIAIDGNERIIWNAEVGHLEVFEGDQPKQNLLLSTRPYFTVRDVKLSPAKNFLALCGSNGVTIVELPRKWGRRYRGEKKEGQIFCRTFNINNRLFTCEKRLRTLHVAWHPLGYEAKQVLCILTNDNRLRFHDVTADLELQVIDLRIHQTGRQDKSFNDSDANETLCLGLSMMNLGEFGICFDFGPPLTFQEPDILWPIYILMGSGDVYLIYTNHQNPTYSEHVIGPLTMLPQAEDNYGSDACSILVLESSPPMLAIATPTGTIYHCFAFSDEKSVLSKQTLYVYEAIELSTDLVANPDDPYSPHPMRLFRDPTCEIRYFCAHENGVHTIVLPILDTIQSECDIIEEKESFSEFLICTRTSTPSDGLLNQELEDQSTPRGLAIEVRQTGSVLLVLMPNNELITHRISPATTLINRKRFPRPALDTSRDSNGAEHDILNLSQVDASRANFDEQIQQILKRKTSIPMLKLSENLEQRKQFEEVANRAVTIFQNEYLKKFDLAAEAITKKLNILEEDMRAQQNEYEKVASDRTEVYNMVVALAAKTEMVCRKQKELLARMDKVLAAVSYGHPDLSDAEAKLRRELSLINGKLHFYRDQLDSVVNKHKYHLNQKDPAFSANSDLILSAAQLNGIQETLTRQGAEIADLKRAIKS